MSILYYIILNANIRVDNKMIKNVKLLIVEGLDNTGKTTLVNELISTYNNIYYIHCAKPKSTDPIECALEQYKYFQEIIDIIRKAVVYVTPTLIILDRSWVGEYVYGCLYRGNGDKYVIDMIMHCYNELEKIKKYFTDINFTYDTLLMTVDDVEFCIKHEDGKSLSELNKENIEKEIERFNDIYNKILEKYDIHKIIVNDGLEFKSKLDIYNSVVNIINLNDE